jgi:hypothetical protein
MANGKKILSKDREKKVVKAVTTTLAVPKKAKKPKPKPKPVKKTTMADQMKALRDRFIGSKSFGDQLSEGATKRKEHIRKTVIRRKKK